MKDGENMKYFFMLVTYEESYNPSSSGWTFALKNKDRWVAAPDNISQYLTAGYVTGIDYVTVGEKAYYLRKSFINLDEDAVVILCVESKQGCDTP